MRLILRFSDGTSESRQPATVPELGAVVRRGGQDWVVASIDTDSDVTVVELRRAPKEDLTDMQVEIA